MKINTADHGQPARYIEAAEAVDFVLDRAQSRYDDRKRGKQARKECLETMVGRLLAALTDNGSLRAAQVEDILHYDISVED